MKAAGFDRHQESIGWRRLSLVLLHQFWFLYLTIQHEVSKAVRVQWIWNFKLSRHTFSFFFLQVQENRHYMIFSGLEYCSGLLVTGERIMTECKKGTSLQGSSIHRQKVYCPRNVKLSASESDDSNWRCSTMYLFNRKQSREGQTEREDTHSTFIQESRVHNLTTQKEKTQLLWP